MIIITFFVLVTESVYDTGYSATACSYDYESAMKFVDCSCCGDVTGGKKVLVQENLRTFSLRSTFNYFKKINLEPP